MGHKFSTVITFLTSFIMAPRKKQSRKKVEKEPLFDDLSPQAKQAIGAIGFVVLGIFLTLSLFDFAGMVGTWARVALDFLFGGGS